MGQYKSIPKISFEDMQDAQRNRNVYVIIHTLQDYEENALIMNTIKAQQEGPLINKLIEDSNFEVNIVIYGKNNCDERPYEKYQKLLGLGFTNVYVYPGGLFEWLCLQDIYGYEEFTTNGQEIDILKYKSEKKLKGKNNMTLLEDYR